MSEGAIIGSGARLLGAEPLRIAGAASLESTEGFTWSSWVKPSAQNSSSEIFRRGQIRVLLEQGVPVIVAGDTRSAASTPTAPASWTHLALSAEPGKLSLFVNGDIAARLATALPAPIGGIVIGGEEVSSRFVGEIDELVITSEAISPARIRF